ncbi:MAG: nucleoside triphosphate pyrophosphohydrolase [Chloroflexi bacterium]|nr:nucleoside triphosphate pyrophosphohydrolase [Chloroflexota bacterium]
MADYLKEFERFVTLVARLRGPGGCPWDREQTHASLRENLLSECYEVLDALDEGHAEKLRDELGDLLMQVVLHAQIAAESGDFEVADVIRRITDKLVHRHPHVFGDVKASTAEDVIKSWEALKLKERGNGASVLDSVPAHMPALAYSQEIQNRVARKGFDWESIEGVFEKLVEEIKELEQAGDQQQQEQEFGDLLFTMVNVSRRMGIDAESALRQASRRFLQRFRHMEEACRQRGIDIGALSLAEQDALWDEAKKGLAE